MAFAQITYRESLRAIEVCLRSVQSKLYHMGFRGKVSRNTLAHANERRDWRIYADFAQVLIHQARRLYAEEDFGVELKETVYALDSTTIDTQELDANTMTERIRQLNRLASVMIIYEQLSISS